jgi:hypothetical protein
MTLSEFSNTLNARAALMKDPALRERLGVVAANEVSAMVKRRVFRDGVSTDGSQIGQYSTKPGWFSTSTRGLPKLAPKGKNGSTRAKKTIYSEQGYRGFRVAVGRQAGKVDLNLTGATFRGVGVGIGGNGLPAFGITTQEALQRIEGNEERFDTVTVTPSEQERVAGREAARRELKFILQI